MPNRELMRHVAPLPDRIDLEPGQMSGVDAVTPHLQALFNNDPEVPPLIAVNASPNGAKWADKAVLAQKVKVHAAKNGNDPVIGSGNLAMVSRWVSWAARRFGIAPSQQLANARQAMLASQATPDSTPAE